MTTSVFTLSSGSLHCEPCEQFWSSLVSKGMWQKGGRYDQMSEISSVQKSTK